MKNIDHHLTAQRLKKIFFQQSSGDMFLENDLMTHTTPEPGETCWEWPREMGTGHIRRIILRRGFEVWINNCNFHTKTKFQYKSPPCLLEFSYIFSGNYLVNYGSNRRKEEYQGEHQGIFFMNNTNMACTVFPEVPIRSVSIHLLADFFCSYFQNNLDNLPPMLADMLKSNEESIKIISRNSSKLRCIVEQILRCSQKGFSRKLFIESKALEFLYLQINEISGDTGQYRHNCKIHPQDKWQVEQARTFLVNNLENPPCLCDLASSHGMSHPKLNRCFKMMYGMTVFQYLRYERMNRAKIMLEYDGLTVTETAVKVGYDSLSHFSQAYKKQFGVSPSSWNLFKK